MLQTDIRQHEEAVANAEMLDRQFVSQGQSEGFDFSEERLKGLSKEVAFANQLWAQQAFSWTQFLTDLEAAVPSRISMESVATNFKDGTIALSGSAISLKDLTALAKGLEDHPAFHNVVISSHKIKTPQTKKKEEEAKPYVVFSLRVTYRSV